MNLLVIADIGGTNARLNLYQINDSFQVSQLIENQTFVTENHSSLSEILKIFLKNYLDKENQLFGCVAIAGLVNHNKFSEAVHINWKSFSSEDMILEFKFKQFFIINDFQAVGESIELFIENNFYELNQTSSEIQQGNFLIFGIGTGVGNAIIYNVENSQENISITTEFSHTSLCVKNIFDYRFQEAKRICSNFLNKKNIPIDSLLSASEFPFLYQYISTIWNTPLIEEKKLQYKSFDFSKELINQGEITNISKTQYKEKLISPKSIIQKFDEGDEISEFVIKYYLELLGNAIHIFGLTHLPLKWILIVGELIKEIHLILVKKKKEKEFYEILLQNIFLENHMKETYKQIHISLFISEQELGLYGALKHFQKHHNQINN